MKKGLSTRALIILIVAAIVLISMIPIVQKTLEVTRLQADVQGCFLSVAGSSLMRTATFSWSDLRLNCPRQVVAFDDEPLDKMNQVIAKNVADCIIKFGEGDLIFKGQGTIFGEVRKACAVCGEFTFSEKAAKKYIPDLDIREDIALQFGETTAFEELIRKRRVPNRQETYYDFFRKFDIDNPEKDKHLILTTFGGGSPPYEGPDGGNLKVYLQFVAPSLMADIDIKLRRALAQEPDVGVHSVVVFDNFGKIDEQCDFLLN